MNPHGGQDWVAFAVVMGILVLSLAAWLHYRRVETGGGDLLDWIRSLGPDTEVDHVDCSNPDCDQTMCRCRKPAECPGTNTLGCEHEGLCWDCRLGCVDCRVAQIVEWASGR